MVPLPSALLEFLRHRLTIRTSASDIADLHRAASAWFADQPLIDEAVAHAISGGDSAAAYDIVERHAERVLAEENWPALQPWLDVLPPSGDLEPPALLVARARIARYRSEVTGAVHPLLRDAAAQLETDKTPGADALFDMV